MPPVIRIPEDVFKRLQQHAVPFEDTPASVINRLLDFFDSHSSASGTSNSATQKSGIPRDDAANKTHEIAKEVVRSVGLTPNSAPDLRYSKIIKARFGDMKASDWADLYRLAHRKAYGVLGSLEALQEKVSWEVVRGKKRAKGFEYGYIAELGFSVRGADTKAIWKRSRELAELCRQPISVTAIGPDKKQIILEWTPDEAKLNRSGSPM